MSVTKIFEQEVRRLARKEFESSAGPIKAENRKLLRALRALEREVEVLKGSISKGIRVGAAGGAESSVFTSDSLRTLRKKLGVSQREMAEMVNVSTQAVYLWERKGGPLRLRNSTRRILAQIQKLNKASVRKVLSGEVAIPV